MDNNETTFYMCKKNRNIFQNRGNIDDQGEMIELIERFGCFVWKKVTSCC